jgi:late competence protein required for DNA uptake (superfamily II DNA/RNA helicase)
MTQQKMIQAMGRIGRNNIQQTYTVRFRDDGMLNQLFMKQEENLEALNMCKLFSSD